MDARRTGWCCLITSLSICGCITPDPSIALLEGELRWMEDQLYMMEDQLEQRCSDLTACRNKVCNCPTPGSVPRSKSPTKSLLPSPVRQPDQNRSVPELIEGPGEPTPAGPPATLPPRRNVDAGDATDDRSNALDTEFDLEDVPNDLLSEPDIQLPAPDPKPSNTRPELETPADDAAHTGAPSFLRENVEQLHLNAARVSTHEMGADREKLLIVVEPRTEEDRYIELSAPVKVSLEDAYKEGADARLASWEFDAIETGRTLRTSNMGQGIHLALDWPKDVPLVDDLRVVVAYTRLNGEEIREEKILHPKIQATTVAGWVPAARSHNESITASGLADETPNVADPFALAKQVDPQPARTVFRTTPIPTTAGGQIANSPASWTEPIPEPRSKLTPIAAVALESVEQRIFGDSAQDSRAQDSRAQDSRAQDSWARDEVRHETTSEPDDLKTVPFEQQLSAKEVESEITAGPTWTPYR